MKGSIRKFAAALVAAVCTCVSVWSQSGGIPVFPMTEGAVLSYSHRGADGELDASCKIRVCSVSGDNTDGSLTLIYNCLDGKGRPFFDGGNVFTMQISRVSGQTLITMDRMDKTIKVTPLIPGGDMSSISVPMTVGGSLPDSRIDAKLGPFRATLTITEKKVLGRKTITIAGRDFDCWLVHEKIRTDTPFSKSTDTADSWYAEGAGCVSQKVYDSKGRIKGSLELTSVE